MSDLFTIREKCEQAAEDVRYALEYHILTSEDDFTDCTEARGMLIRAASAATALVAYLDSHYEFDSLNREAIAKKAAGACAH